MKKHLFFLFTVLYAGAVFGVNVNSKNTAKYSDAQIMQKIGQLFFMDFRNWGKDKNDNYIPLTKSDKTVSSLIRKFNFGGIVLFKENTVNPEQTIKLIQSFQYSAKIPLLIGIDQEGGIVTRLQTGTNMPGNMLLGAANNPALTEKVAETTGRELYCQDINIDFAPVLDVNSNSKNPVIGVRSFGGTPELVSEQGTSFIKGLKNASVLACVKHFPGHGNTATDTHLGLAEVNYSLKQWEKTDLPPFKKAIDNNVGAIMTAHVIVPALDNTKQRSVLDRKMIGTPATLSKKILTDTLRDKLGFKGLIITDAMDMKAISDNFGRNQPIIKTILAGADMPLMPVRVWDRSDIAKLEDTMQVLIQEYKYNLEFRQRVDESYNRIIDFKKNNNIKDSITKKKNILKEIAEVKSIVGSADNLKIEEAASAAGITLLKNEKILPFKMTDKSKILITDTNNLRLSIAKKEIEKIATQNNVNVDIKTIKIEDKSELNAELQKAIKDSDLFIMLTYNLNSEIKLPEEMAEFAKDNNIKTVSLSCRNPYDIAFIPDIGSNICIYGAVSFDQTNYTQSMLSINLISGIKSIFENSSTGTAFIVPKGKLPVDIPSTDGSSVLYKSGFGLTY